MFELKGVSKSFGDTRALCATDLVVTPEKTTVLIGQSGCGKSTLIRLMVGLLLPDSGSITFEGQALTLENAPVLRRKMGYVIQEGGLFPHLTARANVALMARWLGWSEARVNERITELARLTRFPADGLERYPAQLSGGSAGAAGAGRVRDRREDGGGEGATPQSGGIACPCSYLCFAFRRRVISNTPGSHSADATKPCPV